MADVVATIKIMQSSPDVDLADLEAKAREIVSSFEGEVGKTTIEPVAFGLQALNVLFVRAEDKGSVDPIAEKIAELEGVSSAEIVDVRRALG